MPDLTIKEHIMMMHAATDDERMLFQSPPGVYPRNRLQRWVRTALVAECRKKHSLFQRSLKSRESSSQSPKRIISVRSVWYPARPVLELAEIEATVSEYGSLYTRWFTYSRLVLLENGKEALDAFQTS
jgi:hypothetical protein